MLVSDFNKHYKANRQCKVTYVDGGNEVRTGLLLSGVESVRRKKPIVHIDSMAYKVPVANVLKVEPTNKKWEN